MLVGLLLTICSGTVQDWKDFVIRAEVASGIAIEKSDPTPVSYNRLQIKIGIPIPHGLGPVYLQSGVSYIVHDPAKFDYMNIFFGSTVDLVFLDAHFNLGLAVSSTNVYYTYSYGFDIIPDL